MYTEGDRNTHIERKLYKRFGIEMYLHKQREAKTQGENLAQMKPQEIMDFMMWMINLVSKFLQVWGWFFIFGVRESLLTVP